LECPSDYFSNEAGRIAPKVIKRAWYKKCLAYNAQAANVDEETKNLACHLNSANEVIGPDDVREVYHRIIEGQKGFKKCDEEVPTDHEVRPHHDPSLDEKYAKVMSDLAQFDPEDFDAVSYLEKHPDFYKTPYGK
jgi:hypothetical protein